ncbi:glycosyltransferase, partial [Acinetobacter baumannii]|nr:glycosyltransferase [Acinetobacter baumannii]
VSLLGVRQDIPQLMNMCDIFISTSAWEGFGLVLAEAMACSKIVVASNNSGFLEILGEKSPYLAEVGNVNSFYNILKQIISKDEKDLAAIRSANRQIIVENYASHIIMKKWLDLYIENK